MALPQRSYRDTKEIEIDGVDFEVEFTFEAAERQTYLDPGSDAFVVINKMFIIAEDQNGNDVMSSSSNYYRTWDLFYHSSNHIFITGRQVGDDKLQEISKFDLSGNLIWEKTFQ